MIYKILLIFFTFSIIISVMAISKKSNRIEIAEKQIEQYGLKVMSITYFILSLIITIPLIMFYAQSYCLSQTLQWLSAFQIIFAIREFFIGCSFPLFISNGEYRERSTFYKIFMCIFDIYYLYIIVKAII